MLLPLFAHGHIISKAHAIVFKRSTSIISYTEERCCYFVVGTLCPPQMTLNHPSVYIL